MALILTMKPHESFFVGDREVVFKEKIAGGQVLLETDGASCVIDVSHWVEVCPGAQVRLCHPRHDRSNIRFQIMAPSKTVLRADKYHQGKPQ